MGSQDQMIYLDYAAATPVDPAVFAAMQPYYTERFYNPSATYRHAQTVRDDLRKARQGVAEVLGARTSEIIFTAGGTESNNLAIHGVMDRYPGKNIVASAVEHESVLEPIKRYSHKLAPVDEKGVIELAQLEALIDDDTVLVSVMYANNEVGAIQPLRHVARLIKRICDIRRNNNNKTPLYLHTDACQAAQYLDIHVHRLGVDLMTLNGGKIYGPKQSGALFISSQVQLEAQIQGGGQERGLRSGTENIAQSTGFSTALQKVQAHRHENMKNATELQKYFLRTLSEKLPDYRLNGSLKHRLPNNVHITLPGIDNERVLFALDERGVMAAAGSACSASSEGPSHVLRAMGVSDEDARASLRFTFGVHTTQKDIDRATQALVDIVY